MGRDKTVRGFVVALVTAIVGTMIGGAGCASKVSGTGDETHFETCRVDADCKGDGGVEKRCEVGTCRPVVQDGGAGGVGGRSGAGGAPSSGTGGVSPVDRSGICGVIAATNGDTDAAAVKAILGDAAVSCTLRASDYDRSCTKDADCVAVGEGNACTLPCGVKCESTAINGGTLPAYQADYDKTPLAACPDLFCGCPAWGLPRCSAGTCELTPDCSPQLGRICK